MSVEKQHGITVLGKVVDDVVSIDYDDTTSGAYSLAAGVQSLYVDTTGGAITVTLPAPGECKFQIIAITALTGGTNAVTVQDNDDSYDWSDASLNADADGGVWWSDGKKFWKLADDYT